MKTWNVVTGVVQLIDAETAEEARRMADLQVYAAVREFADIFDLDDVYAQLGGVVFESEPID